MRSSLRGRHARCFSNFIGHRLSSLDATRVRVGVGFGTYVRCGLMGRRSRLDFVDFVVRHSRRMIVESLSVPMWIERFRRPLRDAQRTFILDAIARYRVTPDVLQLFWKRVAKGEGIIYSRRFIISPWELSDSGNQSSCKRQPVTGCQSPYFVLYQRRLHKVQ